ncbi:MAG: sigma-54-dependent Fis family transcriptional regulator [Nitrospinaceae bacterium]|nr:MAG: sigma-54-dependent Fis family transcriptional regulator [Nitrospinaceae bacterium]
MPNAAKILVVDDEENIRWVFQKALVKRGLEVDAAASAEEALEKIQTSDYLMVFTDIFMGGQSGLDLLDAVKPIAPGLKVVVMTAEDTMNNTIEAMRRGAFDYIGKPFDFDEVYALIDRALKSRAAARPEGEPEGPAGREGFSLDAIVGKSRRMQEIFKTIGRAAPADLAVLITGESGTGKEMVARALHYYSPRRDKPFICINCAAISRDLLETELFGHEKGAFTGAVESKEGKFELADGGTLFLDEIGDMELALQAKILRVLQDHQFFKVGGRSPIHSDARIVAATNQDLAKLMEEKRFREDLYHRLNVIPVHLPPLRERMEDVPLIARHFLGRFRGVLGRGDIHLSPEAERIFLGYRWPGNIRELENVVKRAMVLASSGPILLEHLPPSMTEGRSPEFWEDRLVRLIDDYLKQSPHQKDGRLHEHLTQAIEKCLFEQLLKEHAGKQVPVARKLGINRNTLKRKIDQLGIDLKKVKNRH